MQWLHTAGTGYPRAFRPPKAPFTGEVSVLRGRRRRKDRLERHDGFACALITGVTGQDGACLAELLLDRGYVVHGVKRRSSSFNTGRIDHLYLDPHEGDTRFFLHYGDLTDATNLVRLVQETRPDEIYNWPPRATSR